MQKVKKILTQYLWLFWLAVPIVSRAGCDSLNCGLDETMETVGSGKLGGDDLPTKIGSVIGTLLEFTGVAFFLLIVYAGITWMTAAGDPGPTKKAKDIMTAAIVGLIFVLSAYAITSFIGQNVSK